MTVILRGTRIPRNLRKDSNFQAEIYWKTDEEALAETTQILESLQRVRNKHHDFFLNGLLEKLVVDLLIVDNGKCRALLQSLNSKLVSIERLALECNKNATHGAITTIGSHNRMLLIESV